MVAFNFLFDNPILWADGYKYSHWPLLPEGTTSTYTYWEPRGGRSAEVMPIGMQYYRDIYLARKITMEHIEEAESYLTPYFNDATMFNMDGFLRIVREHDGHWPMRVRFAPEGLPIPTRNVFMDTESTDEKLPWVPGFMETLESLLWYPSTVATLSREMKKAILAGLIKSGTPSTIHQRLVDFGMRGVSSIESGGIGGFAHLANFSASDTLSALKVARQIYGEPCAANSIPAMEHGTVLPWLKSGEYNSYKNMIQQYGNSGAGAYAIVIDSYDPFEAVEIFGRQLLNVVRGSTSMLILRPDSGVPHEIIRQLCEKLEPTFGSTVNEKGYKVINSARLIQGDSISEPVDITRIHDALMVRGWSADMVSFGSGGGLLQKMDRDTHKFAIKGSSAIINGRRVDYRKEPVTDISKWSKAGRLKLIRGDDGVLTTVPATEIGHNLLNVVYEKLPGQPLQLPTNHTLAEIRARAELPIDDWNRQV